jgi:putative DNA primase/helicase
MIASATEFPGLRPDDLEDLRRSELSDETIKSMGCFSAETDQIMDWTGVKQIQSGGYFIPYTGLTDQTGLPLGRWRLRKPAGKMKYVGGLGDDPALYLPPNLEALPSHDLLIVTEGEKKAAKAVQEGTPCVAIAGVWAWPDPDNRAGEKVRGDSITSETAPLQKLIALARLYKCVLVLGDSDLLSKFQARAGLENLTSALISRAIRAALAFCPPAPTGESEEEGITKQGLDDWLIADCRHVIRSLPALFRASEINRVSITDHYNATQVAVQFTNRLAFSQGIWRWWDGSIWVRDDCWKRRAMVTEIAEVYRAEAEKLSRVTGKAEAPYKRSKRAEVPAEVQAWCRPIRTATNALLKAARDICNQRGMDAALAIAQSSLRVPDDAWDRDPELLGVPNGVLNLRAGTLLQATPEQRITRCTAAAYDPEASAPNFGRFLERVQPNPEMREFLQRLAGYGAIGRGNEQKFFVFTGIGENGKGTFISSTIEPLGNYAVKASPGLIAEQSPDKPRNDIAKLAGARLVSLSENSENLRFDTAAMKMLTGDDLVSARFLNQEFFQFRPMFTPILDTNCAPRPRDNGHAVWRRLRIVPWSITITEGERDIKLREKLLSELPGILNWIVDGARKYLEDGLREPAQVKEATRALRLSCDDLGRWLEERVVIGQVQRNRTLDLYQDYLQWCRAEGIPNPLLIRNFPASLESRGYQRGKSNGIKIIKGLRLRNQVDGLVNKPKDQQGSIESVDGTGRIPRAGPDPEPESPLASLERLPGGRYVI